MRFYIIRNKYQFDLMKRVIPALIRIDYTDEMQIRINEDNPSDWGFNRAESRMYSRMEGYYLREVEPYKPYLNLCT